MQQRRLLRYILFLLGIVLLLRFRQFFIGEYVEPFDYRPMQWLSIIVLFLIGAMIACLERDVFRKETWRFQFKVDVFLVFLVFVLFGFTYIHTWRFVLDLLAKFSQSINTILFLAQLMTGFIFMQFFLVSKEDPAL